MDDTFGGDPDVAHPEEQTNHRNDNNPFNEEDIFKTPDMFVRQLESLERKTFNGDNNHPNPSRKSLLRNFDPLIDPLDPSNDSFISKFSSMGLSTPGRPDPNRSHFDINSHNMSVMSAQRNHNQSYAERTHNESTTLLKFNSPYPMPPNTAPSKSSNDQNDGNNHNNCDLFSNDFPLNDLSLQEKLIEKDRLIMQLQEQLNQRDNECQNYEMMVNLMHNCNQEVVEVAAEDQLNTQ